VTLVYYLNMNDCDENNFKENLLEVQLKKRIII
jgi:hypothetical protein